MAVKSKKAIKPENLPPTEGSAWQHSLKFIEKSHTGKYYTIQHLIRLNGGWKLAKDRLQAVMTEQVSLGFRKLFRNILKIFNSDNTSSGFKYL